MKHLFIGLLAGITLQTQVQAMNFVRQKAMHYMNNHDARAFFKRKFVDTYNHNKADFNSNRSQFLKEKMSSVVEKIGKGFIGGVGGSVVSGLAIAIGVEALNKTGSIHKITSDRAIPYSVLAGGYAGAFKLGGIPGIVTWKFFSDIWPLTAAIKEELK